ncbi:MAG: hypothetical protein LBQ65_10480 [Tannerellaceae bacterium]|nr:hypothetical protein [Tannerellaceae bacterium]
MLKMLLPAMILCIVFSCSEEPSENERVVRIATDWRNRSQGVEVPPQYSLKTGELHLHGISEETYTIPHIFQPGRHSIYVYNPASNISIDGTTASVEVENGFMKALPGWFFTFAHHITIEEGKDYTISAVMQQQIGELNFVLLSPKSFAKQVSRIQGSLNGVASQLDIPSGELIGQPISVMLDFTKDSDSTFVASTRIAGIIGNVQLLNCRIVFKDDSLPVALKMSDLHYVLEDFNADKLSSRIVSIELIPEEEGLRAIKPATASE